MNDRVLRNTVVGLGSKMDGVVREDHFSFQNSIPAILFRILYLSYTGLIS
jgi:formyltetrahydrofolate synthetase